MTNIGTIQELEEHLSRPTDADVAALAKMDGDLLILGAGGKMGPSLCRLARRAADEARAKQRILAVSRFADEASRHHFSAHNIDTIACDLLEPGALAKLPDARNVIFMAARKFGTTGAEHMTWAMNTFLPGLVAERYGESHIVAFSTGNVYPLKRVNEGGSIESDPEVACSFVVGLAAVWLLMPFLESRYRILVFFKTLLVLAGFGLLAFLPTLLANRSSWLDFRPFLAGLLALASLAVTLALTFGSLAVRHRFGRFRLLLWLAVWMVVAWTAIATPFAVVALLKGNMDWVPALLSILSISAISLGLVLPLVLLSFFQPFYRERFFGYLKIPQAGTPAEAAAPPILPAVGQAEGTTTAAVTEK